MHKDKKCILISGFIIQIVFSMEQFPESAAINITHKRFAHLSDSSSSNHGSPYGTPIANRNFSRSLDKDDNKSGLTSVVSNHVKNAGGKLYNVMDYCTSVTKSALGAYAKANDPDHRAIVLGLAEGDGTEEALKRNKQAYEYSDLLLSTPYHNELNSDLIGAVANRARLASLYYLLDQRTDNTNIKQKSAAELAHEIEKTSQLMHKHYRAFLNPLLMMASDQLTRQEEYIKRQHLNLDANETQMAIIYNLLQQLKTAMAALDPDHFLQEPPNNNIEQEAEINE